MLPLPESIPRFVCGLPRIVSVPGETPWVVSELAFEFQRTYYRSYLAEPWPDAGTQTMHVGTYTANTLLGTVEFAIAVNQRSSEWNTVVKNVLVSVARKFCFDVAYDYVPQSPPAPAKPANPGWGAPLSNEAVENPEKGIPLRGVCAGVKVVALGDVEDYAGYVDRVFTQSGGYG